MREQGRVSKILINNRAVVELERSPACAKCQACIAGIEGKMQIEVANLVGAQVGDLVELEVPSDGILKSSLIIFLLPIVLLILGYFLGAAAFGLELIAISLALIFLFLSYFVIKWYDRRFVAKNHPQPKICRVISSA